MKKNLTFLYAVTLLFYWMGFAATSAFVSTYLLSLDISNSVIGTVIAAGGITSAVLQPVFGTLSDRYAFFSVKKIIAVSVIIIAVSCLAMLTGPGKTLAAACILFAVCLMLLQVMQPFVNSLGMLYLNAGYQLDFGLSRAAGSLGYAFTAFLLGRLSAQIGAWVIPVFMLITYSASAITLLFYPKVAFSVKSSEESKPKRSAIDFFRRYRQFTVFLAAMILIYFGHVLINCFTLQIMQTKGGGSAEMGISTSIGAMLELITMMLFSRILKKFSIKTLLRISGIFFTLKIIGSLVAASPVQFYLVQILQMGGWAIMAVGLVYYVNSVMDESDKTTGQSYATMTYSVGSVLGAWIGGFIIDLAGIPAMLITAAVLSAIGAGMIFIATNDRAA